jgi:hypothetical protein
LYYRRRPGLQRLPPRSGLTRTLGRKSGTVVTSAASASFGVSQTATSAAAPRMTATSQASETTLGIDTKFGFVGRSWGPRSRSDLERPLRFEAKSRLGGSGVQSVRRAAELKSVRLRPAPVRRRLQDPDAHSRQRGAGSVCGLPAGATGLCRPRPPRVNPALRPNPSLKTPTRYGRQRKPGLRHMVHHLSPSLRRLPPRSA